MSPLYILIVGNPGDGFGLYGPFSDANDANEYGDEHHSNSEYWVMSVVRAPGCVPDEVALDGIAAMMSGTEWSADTLEAVAGYVRSTGRGISDYEGGTS